MALFHTVVEHDDEFAPLQRRHLRNSFVTLGAATTESDSIEGYLPPLRSEVIERIMFYCLDDNDAECTTILSAPLDCAAVVMI
jgi:hypothetical protein